MIEEVLEFWFGTLHQGFADDAVRARWFAADPSFDARIRDRFGDLPEAASRGRLDVWKGSPRGSLAFILVTDQFTRNIHRGTAHAFSCDDLALAAAKETVRAGRDRPLAFDERCFVYLPFEHSEDLIDQHTSVGLFTRLRDDTPAGKRHITGEALRFAHQHRDIIERFGRFPHRNAALGRHATEAEAEFARGGSFGQ